MVIRTFVSPCVGVKTNPLHVEGERLPASGFRLGPAEHHVGVAHLAGVDVCGRERSFDVTCTAKREGGGGGRKRENKVRTRSGSPKSALLFYFLCVHIF